MWARETEGWGFKTWVLKDNKTNRHKVYRSSSGMEGQKRANVD